MNILRHAWVLSILFCVPFTEAKPLSDSLPIQGNFSQDGHWVSRFKVERFLLKQDSSVEFVDHSLGYKWSGHSIGAMLWCVNIGVSLYQLKQVIDAIEKQNILLDTTGKQEALTNRLYQFTIPLTIGSEVASFVQSRLYNRSDYLLHKGALAYNASVAQKYPGGPGIDLHIEKDRNGWYKQGGLLMTEPVLYGVLREQSASRAGANWSAVLKEIGTQVGSWGGMYIGLALLSYLQESMADTSIIIDKKARESNLTIGITLTSFSIIDAIVSAVTRNAAIKRYNAALPARHVAPVAPRDSSQTGIIEGPAKKPADTTATPDTTTPKKEQIGQ
jgi:hypothetical protein